MAVSQIGLIGLAVMGQVRGRKEAGPGGRFRNQPKVGAAGHARATATATNDAARCLGADCQTLCTGTTLERHVASVTPRLWPASPQNMALNIAEKGFPISVYNRSYDKTQAAVKRAEKEGKAERASRTQPFQCSWRPRLVPRRMLPALACAGLPGCRDGCFPLLLVLPGLGTKLHGYEDVKDFVMSLQKPRCGSRPDPPLCSPCR
jgi:hypothetical protein